MALEIERKYLLSNDLWRAEVSESQRIAQGYLCTEPDRVVRVRIKGQKAFLTIKGKSIDGIARAEFEYEIPLDDAQALLDICPNILDKTRHIIVSERGLTWEIDEFHGLNAGLIVAEIEIPNVDTVIPKPDWLGQEVSNDPRYYNSALSEKPYSQWNH